MVICLPSAISILVIVFSSVLWGLFLFRNELHFSSDSYYEKNMKKGGGQVQMAKCPKCKKKEWKSEGEANQKRDSEEKKIHREGKAGGYLDSICIFLQYVEGSNLKECILQKN